MDRSYPYSRRLISRARLRKRMAAVVAAGLVGATALFMSTWTADPFSAAVAPHRGPLLASGGSTGEAQPRKLRRIYPYSIVPGGVSGQAELARVIRTDRVVATHYASFDVDKAHPVVVEKPRAVHVSYRKNGQVYWTARKVMLAAGETLLSDGRNEMRARCANRISDVPQYPVEAHQPDMEELDNPVEVDEGAQLTVSADGLPVSVDAMTGPAQQAGQRFPISGGNGFLGAAPAGAPADTLLASIRYSSGPAPSSPVTTTSSTGSSSSVGSRPRPDSNAPLTPPTDSTGANGGSGSSSDSPAPAGATETPSIAPAPQPEPTTTLPPAQTPAPAGGQGGTPVQEPTPTPHPEMPLPPVFTPDPLPQPGGEQSGGGSSGEPLPTTPTGPGPLFPEPGPDTEPFIPKPEPTPPPGAGTGIEASNPPAGVPEPGSLGLAAIGLAALARLRILKRGS